MPSAPTGLTATGATGSVALAWSASTDNVGVAGYRVYRSTTSGFTPSATNLVAHVTSGTAYADAVAAGTYYYLVTAYDAAGNEGAPSEPGQRGRHARHDLPLGADEPGGDRRNRQRRPGLGGLGRQRRSDGLRRLPFHGLRLHPLRRPSRRPGDHHELHRLGRGGHLLLPRDRPRRRRQCQHALEPGQRHRHAQYTWPGRRLQCSTRAGGRPARSRATATTAPSPTPPGPPPASSATP